jgi:hypothetical protein
MAKPIIAASVVSPSACHNSPRSRLSPKSVASTFDGAGTRNDGTHPIRTAVSIAASTTTSGTSGGSATRARR